MIAICNMKNKIDPFPITLILLVFLFSGFAAGTLAQTPPPEGRITLPLIESLTNNTVDVTGFTRHIGPSKHIWIVIDQNDRGFCRPRGKPIAPNTAFTLRISAEGHPNAFILSLYAVDKKINEKIVNWISDRPEEGFPLLPQDCLLHSIRLWNQKPNE